MFPKPPKKLPVTATELPMSSFLLGSACAIAPPMPPAIPLSPWAADPKSKVLNLSFVPWEKNGWLSKRPRLTKATLYIFFYIIIVCFIKILLSSLNIKIRI